MLFLNLAARVTGVAIMFVQSARFESEVDDYTKDESENECFKRCFRLEYGERRGECECEDRADNNSFENELVH